MSTRVIPEVVGLIGQASKTEPVSHATQDLLGLSKRGGYASNIALLAALVVLLVQISDVVDKNSLLVLIQGIIYGLPDVIAANPYEMLVVSHATLGLLIFLMISRSHGKKAVYLIDFYSFRPPSHLQSTRDQIVQGYAQTGLQSEENMDFINRVSDKSGLGEQTFMPEDISRGWCHDLRGRLSFEDTRRETEAALFASIGNLLKQTGIHPHQIDAVIINCCNFTTVPSLASAVVNWFRLKPSVLSFNLSGMGCAATVIATGIADELLQNHKNMRVLIASSENIHRGVYQGRERSMIISNLIFRYGGVAVLMSNHPADRKKAKYQLQHVVRTHLGADNAAYNCVMEQADGEGRVGNKIGKDLLQAANKSLAVNIRTLAPLVLPLSEKLKYALRLLQRQVLKKRVPEYKPDFSKAFDHFCIHTGGKAVIDAMEQNLRLKPGQGDPCRAAFHRYGNTSSSSTWYNWSYIEIKTGIKKGDRIWQLSFGSGFKVASAVWTALRPINTQHDAWTETPSC